MEIKLHQRRHQAGGLIFVKSVFEVILACVGELAARVSEPRWATGEVDKAFVGI